MKTLAQHLLAAAVCVAIPLTATAAHPDDAPLPLSNRIIIGSLAAAAEKTTQLATAIPDGKYNWSPADGVRSVREILTHVAGANYYVGNMLGLPVPAGVDPRMIGKGMNKAELIAAYRESVAFAKKAVAQVSAEQMAEEIEFWGNRAPRAQLAMVLVDHAHEHLGQLIAYARSNGVVPPWSRSDE